MISDELQVALDILQDQGEDESVIVWALELVDDRLPYPICFPPGRSVSGSCTFSERASVAHSHRSPLFASVSTALRERRRMRRLRCSLTSNMLISGFNWWMDHGGF